MTQSLSTVFRCRFVPRGPPPQNRPSAPRRAPRAALGVALRRTRIGLLCRRALRRGVRARRRADRRGQPGVREDVRLLGRGGPGSDASSTSSPRSTGPAGRADPDAERGAASSWSASPRRRGPCYLEVCARPSRTGARTAGGGRAARRHRPRLGRGGGGCARVPVCGRPDRRRRGGPAAAADGRCGSARAGDLRGRARACATARWPCSWSRTGRGNLVSTAIAGADCGPLMVPMDATGSATAQVFASRRAVLRRPSRPASRRLAAAGRGIRARHRAVAAGAARRRPRRRAARRLGPARHADLRPRRRGRRPVRRRGGRRRRAGRHPRPARRAEHRSRPAGRGAAALGSVQVGLRLERLARAAHAAGLDPRLHGHPRERRGGGAYPEPRPSSWTSSTRTRAGCSR